MNSLPAFQRGEYKVQVVKLAGSKFRSYRVVAEAIMFPLLHWDKIYIDIDEALQSGETENISQ